METKVVKEFDENKKNVKTIKHGSWDFDYNSFSNIYVSDIESYEKKKFNHLNQNSELNIKYCNLTEQDLEDFRKAALIHKVARKKAVSLLHTGSKVAALVDAVESVIIKLCKQDSNTYFSKGSISAGIAFPVGVNINNIVAHDSKTLVFPEERVFYKGDVVKVDIGVHINGRIIDSAFTHIVTDQPGVHDSENIYNSVLEASKESMFNAIKMAGPEQRLDEISETIQEVIESFEVMIGEGSIPVRSVAGIGGHNIKQYQIHGGKLVLCVPNKELQQDDRMEEDEIYAIETFASTGYGMTTQNTTMDKCTHFMETREDELRTTKKERKLFKTTDLYNWLQTRNGLPFSSSWIDIKKIPKFEKFFKLGIASGQITAYPPLFDEENSVVAQFEHTIHIKDNTVEIFSLGEDY
jgi:methionyl aminopeptidase